MSQSRSGKRDRSREIKIPARDLVLFTRQFATMIRAGIPVTFALDTLSQQPENPTFSQVIARISQMVGEGHKLSHAMGHFPRVFDNVFRSMVSIGEETGNLDATLERLAGWRERDFNLVRQVKGALSYPVFILIVTLFLAFILFYSILPTFLDIFKSMKIELPIYTRIMMTMTEAVQNPGAWLVATALGVATYHLLNEQMKTFEGRTRIFRALHEIPVIGHLIRITALARFAGGVESLMESGLSLQKTLALGGESSGNPIVIAAAEEIIKRVRDGDQISEYVIMRDDIFPVVFAQYIATGEETSSLAKMMGQAAIMMDDEVNYKVDALAATIEPVMMGLVAIIVAFVLLSIFTPLYNHIGSMGM